MNKEKLIQKWLKGELTATEKEAFQLLDDADFNAFIVDYAQHFKASNHSQLADFETFKKHYNNYKKPVRQLQWFNPVLKIASIIVIALGLYFAIIYNPETSIQTLASETSTITLPDNSKVELNQLSKLIYNKGNWDKNRQLKLKGEAFFDVEKGKRFDVTTEFGNVSVLGTEFNVLSRDSIFKVSCYEGLVQVVYGNQTAQLPAGTEFVLKSGTVEQTLIATAEPYWLKNMSVFENASIDQVIQEIEKQFNITILRKFDKNQIMFTGAFEHKNLENALKSVTQPLSLTYEITNSKEVTIKNAKE